MRTTTSFDAAIRPATADDRTYIAETLASAFSEDPIFGWVYPGAAWREQVLPAFFATFADTFTPHGATFVTDGGVAMWVPAGVEALSGEEADRFTTTLVEMSGPYADRLGEVSATIDAAHPHAPCAYLQFVGVEAARQGQGIGSLAMRPMLAACDADGIPAFLVATSARNRALYERRGFGVIDELHTSDCPPMWAMWREPVC